MKKLNYLNKYLTILIIITSISKFSFAQAIDPETESNQTAPVNDKFDPLSKLIPPPYGDYPFNSYSYVVAGNNSTSNTGRAPQGSRKYIRSVYLVTPAEMGASGFGISQIRSIGWTWNHPNGAGAPVAQSVQTTGYLNIYFQCTTDNVYSKGTNFITAVGSMTQVANTTITIPAGAGAFAIDVPLEGLGSSCFYTCDGENPYGLYIAFEYSTTSPLATPLGAPTILCDNTQLNSIATYQSQTGWGTAMTMSNFRPVTRLGGGQTPFAEDVNSDQIVDLDDIMICENELVDFCNTCNCLSDVDNNGYVSIADLTLIRNKLCQYVQ